MSEPRDLLDPVRQYLAEPRRAVLSTINPDGAPHQVVVDYLLEHDALLVNGRDGRRWVANLRRDPRLSLLVYDADRPLHWVRIKGTAELLRVGKGAVDDAVIMARRYGEDPSDYLKQKRVTYRIVVRQIYEYG